MKDIAHVKDTTRMKDTTHMKGTTTCAKRDTGCNRRELKGQGSKPYHVCKYLSQ